MVMIAIVGILGFVYLNNRIVTSQRPTQNIATHPTHDEWLEIYTSHRIHELTDLWKVRVAANVVIFSRDADGKPIFPREMVITIVAANGEDALSTSAKDGYKRWAETTAKSILTDYGVTAEYKLTVQCL